jgi:hypothetical protein
MTETPQSGMECATAVVDTAMAPIKPVRDDAGGSSHPTTWSIGQWRLDCPQM